MLSVFTSLHLTPPPSPALGCLYRSTPDTPSTNHTLHTIDTIMPFLDLSIRIIQHLGPTIRSHTLLQSNMMTEIAQTHSEILLFTPMSLPFIHRASSSDEHFGIMFDVGRPQEEGPCAAQSLQWEQAASQRHYKQTSRKLISSMGRILGKGDKIPQSAPLFSLV